MGARVECLDIPGLAAPLGPYAHAVRVGELLFLSGLLALDDSGRIVGPGDAGRQADHIFAVMETILQAAGGSLAQVAKLTFFLVDLSDRAALSAVRRRVFGAHRPASTLVQVAGLIGEGSLLEVEAIAALR